MKFWIPQAFLFGWMALSSALMAAPPSASTALITGAGREARNPETKIDALIEAKLSQEGLEPNALADDATFLRRVYLDIVGRIPTIEEAESFYATPAPLRRAELIDDLLDSEGYVSHFYNFWADVLRVNRNLGNANGNAEAAYQLWIKESLRENRSYQTFAREMVSARGHIWENGAVGYYQRDRGMPLDNMSNTVRVFLGTRLECAQCHNHPFDKWTQMDYFKMAAFSYSVDANNRGYGSQKEKVAEYQRSEKERLWQKAVGKDFPPYARVGKINERTLDSKRGAAYLESTGLSKKQFLRTIEKGKKAMGSFDKDIAGMRKATQEVYNRIQYTSVSERQKTLKLPHDYQYSDAKPHDAVSPVTMFGGEIDESSVEDLLDAYAEWMTSKENPTFTRVIANRLWKKAFGHGVFEPADEITDVMHISNPELMAYLEELMRELDYDMKGFLRILFRTNAYQREADRNEIIMGAPYYFAGPVLRRMSAEQIWDSVVSLCLPEADSYRPRLKSQLSGIENVKRMYESLEEHSPEDFVQMLIELGDALQKDLPRQEKLRTLIVTARQEERISDYQKYRSELSQLQKAARKAVSEIAFTHVGEKVDGAELIAALGMQEMAVKGMSSTMMSSMNAGENMVLTELPKPKFRDVPEELDRNEQKKWQARQKTDYNLYRNLVSGMARASELQSPAPRGHFLREFGQSDREVIENASDAASVPQALNLLNGPMVQALTNRFAVFGNRLHEAGYPEEKTRMMFQAMLTREPTEREIAMVLAEVEKQGSQAYEAVVWSLLNTQQFLFVQ